MRISDGTGTGFEAGVNQSNRLMTESVSRMQSTLSSFRGQAFNINTGIITLTSATKSAVLYLRNNGDNPIIIESLFYLIGASTGGSGDMIFTVLRNPQTGTIITNGTLAEMAGVNRNFGSSQQLAADILKGAEGNTFTSGEKVIESIVTQVPSRIALSAGDIILPKGSSIGVEVTPGTGNTSFKLEVAASCYIDTEGV